MQTLRRFAASPLPYILVLALFIRLLALSHAHDFIWDELFSFTYSQKPWSDTLRLWLLETNPPLHMLFLKLWWYVVPANEFFARLPSVIFGTLAVAVTYRAAEKIDRKITWLAALILALHPYFTLQSTLARGYSLLVLLTALSLNTFFTCIQSKQPTRQIMVQLALWNMLLLLDHLTGAFLLIAETVYIVALERSLFKKWLVACAPLALPAVWIIVSMIARNTGDISMENAWFFKLSTIPWWAKWSPINHLFFGPYPLAVSIAIVALFLVVGILAIRRALAAGYRNKPLVATALFFFLTVLAMIALQLWHFKFLTVTLPAFAILVAWCGAYVFRRSIVAAFGFLIIIVPGIITTLSLIDNLSNWTAYNQALNQKYDTHRKQLLISNNYMHTLLIDRYYQSPIPVLVYQTTLESSDLESAYITLNYRLYEHPRPEMSEWYEKNNIDSYSEIFFLYDPYIGVDLQSILIRHGWHIVSTSGPTPGADEKMMLYTYEKP